MGADSLGLLQRLDDAICTFGRFWFLSALFLCNNEEFNDDILKLSCSSYMSIQLYLFGFIIDTTQIMRSILGIHQYCYGMIRVLNQNDTSNCDPYQWMINSQKVPDNRHENVEDFNKTKDKD